MKSLAQSPHLVSFWVVVMPRPFRSAAVFVSEVALLVETEPNRTGFEGGLYSFGQFVSRSIGPSASLMTPICFARTHDLIVHIFCSLCDFPPIEFLLNETFSALYLCVYEGPPVKTRRNCF